MNADIQVTDPVQPTDRKWDHLAETILAELEIRIGGVPPVVVIDRINAVRLLSAALTVICARG